MKPWIKIPLFQGLWFLCAFSVDGGYSWFALSLCLLFTILDWYMVRTFYHWKKYFLFTISLVFLGGVVDTLFVYLGLLEFLESFYSPAMVGIWLIFAVYYHDLFEKFHGLHGINFILGAIFGPLAYFSGMKLGALTFYFTSQPITVGFLALVWGTIFSGTIEWHRQKFFVHGNEN